MSAQKKCPACGEPFRKARRRIVHHFDGSISVAFVCPECVRRTLWIDASNRTLHADEGDQATGKRKDGSWGIDLALVLSDAERAQLLADLQAPENVRREIAPAQSLVRRGDRS